MRFIGIVTMLGLVLGAWFGIQAVAAEVRYNKCVDNNGRSALSCLTEK